MCLSSKEVHYVVDTEFVGADDRSVRENKLGFLTVGSINFTRNSSGELFSKLDYGES